MKKVIFAVLISFAFMASVSSQSTFKPIVFKEIYQEVLQLNHDRFVSVDRIQIGDTVLFPSLTIGGVNQFLVADAPVNGVHDCLYRMTGKYIYGQLKTTPLPVAKKVVPVPVKAQDVPFWASDLFLKSLIGIMILMTLIYLVVYYGYMKNRNVNSNPVVLGGLSDNPVEAAAQVNALIPGSRVVKSERGRLIGVTPTKVKMNFSDGIKKVKLISGEEYYRITQADRAVRYARKSCGNLIDGSLAYLPEGWTFVPSTEENSTWVAPKTEEKTVVEAKVDSKPETEEVKPEIKNDELFKDSVLNGFDVAIILDAAGKMSNHPSSISVGDLTVHFYKNNEKAE